MRSTVELYVAGSTLSEIMKDAKKRWQDFCGDENAVLPADSELQIKDKHEDKGLLTGIITIRTKVEDK
jgi:hypothetical protein